jgi:hypothetical protein
VQLANIGCRGSTICSLCMPLRIAKFTAMLGCLLLSCSVAEAAVKGCRDRADGNDGTVQKSVNSCEPPDGKFATSEGMVAYVGIS